MLLEFVIAAGKTHKLKHVALLLKPSRDSYLDEKEKKNLSTVHTMAYNECFWSSVTPLISPSNSLTSTPVITHSTPDTLASILLFEHVNHNPISGFGTFLSLLPKMLFLQIIAWRIVTSFMSLLQLNVQLIEASPDYPA